MLSKIVDILPNIIGAFIILTLTYIIANFVSKLVKEFLNNLGIDSLPEKIGIVKMQA